MKFACSGVILMLAGLLWTDPVQGGEIDDAIEKVRAGLKPLDLSTPQEHGAANHAFFDYYELNVEGASHWLGTLESAPYTIAVHVFVPAKPRGTVLIVHGYYDHAGIWKHVIGKLVSQGYRVVVYDQPGHGLSSGTQASIDDFAEYLAVFKDCLALCRKHFDGTIDVAAHSTGCSVVMDYLLSSGDNQLGRVVMVAPLIRSVAWGLSGFGMGIIASKAEYVPRTFRRNSSDRAFLKFMKQDPLQARKVPTAWVLAHRAWVERIEKAKPVDRPVRVLQGTKDSTVDWEYNLPVIRKLFPRADIHKIEKGGHQLINESTKLRDRTLDLLCGWLEME